MLDCSYQLVSEHSVPGNAQGDMHKIMESEAEGDLERRVDALEQKVINLDGKFTGISELLVRVAAGMQRLLAEKDEKQKSVVGESSGSRGEESIITGENPVNTGEQPLEELKAMMAELRDLESKPEMKNINPHLCTFLADAFPCVWECKNTNLSSPTAALVTLDQPINISLLSCLINVEVMGRYANPITDFSEEFALILGVTYCKNRAAAILYFVLKDAVENNTFDSGGNLLVSSTTWSSCFKLWDPGGRLIIVCYLHLEDKVNV